MASLIIFSRHLFLLVHFNDFFYTICMISSAAEFYYCCYSIAASVHVYNTTVTIDDDGQLSKCAANTVKFLDPGGTIDKQQGFIAICLATMSRPPGWALFCDDGDDNLRLIGPMYAACRQQGFFGKPSSLSRYVHISFAEVLI